MDDPRVCRPRLDPTLTPGCVNVVNVRVKAATASSVSPMDSGGAGVTTAHTLSNAAYFPTSRTQGFAAGALVVVFNVWKIMKCDLLNSFKDNFIYTR